VLTLFRTNQISGALSFLLYLFILRGVDILFPYQHVWQPTAMGVASEWILQQVSDNMSLDDIFSFALLFIQAILITVVVRKHQLLMTDILMPGAFFILVSCAIPAFLHLSPQMLANTFIIIALDQLLVTYRKNNFAHHLFNVGFWIGIASLFYFSYITFILLVFLGLPSIRAFNVREILMMLIGAIVTYFLAGAYYFLIDQFPYFLERQFYQNLGILNFKGSLDLNTFVALSIFALVLFTVLFGYGNIILRKNISFQKKIGIFYFALLISSASLFIQSNVDLAHLMMLTVPLGFLLGVWAKEISPTMAEVFHLFLVVIILVWQAFPFWGN
jgi:hypothetical protein